MCDICIEFESGRLSSKQAFERITDALQNADKQTTKHLISLSNKILDKDVPMPERDEYADWVWNESYDDRE